MFYEAPRVRVYLGKEGAADSSLPFRCDDDKYKAGFNGQQTQQCDIVLMLFWPVCCCAACGSLIRLRLVDLYKWAAKMGHIARPNSTEIAN